MVTSVAADSLMPARSVKQTLGSQKCAHASDYCQHELSWKAPTSMCNPPALVGCCEGAQHCARHMATRQNGLPLASERMRGAIACVRSPRGAGWLAFQCHFRSGHLPDKRWVAALRCGMLVRRRCCEIAHCCSGNAWFWLGMVQANVGQKRLKRNIILRRFFLPVIR